MGSLPDRKIPSWTPPQPIPQANRNMYAQHGRPIQTPVTPAPRLAPGPTYGRGQPLAPAARGYSTPTPGYHPTPMYGSAPPALGHRGVGRPRKYF